jgi:leucyl-tRNA synthetase
MRGGIFMEMTGNQNKIAWHHTRQHDHLLDRITHHVLRDTEHDERDFAFAEKHGLQVKQVVAPYVRLSGDYEPRVNKETRTRAVVTAIIRRAGTDEYLLQDMADGRRGFTGGGVEEGVFL